jgi:hypothetical protein
MAKQFQRRRFFRNRPITNKNCLLTDRDEISNLHRGHSIDASCQVSVNLAKRFQRKLFKIGQSETRIACGAEWKVSDTGWAHWASSYFLFWKYKAQWFAPLYRRCSTNLSHFVALRKLNTEPSIGASHQVSVHLATVSSFRKEDS